MASGNPPHHPPRRAEGTESDPRGRWRERVDEGVGRREDKSGRRAPDRSARDVGGGSGRSDRGRGERRRSSRGAGEARSRTRGAPRGSRAETARLVILGVLFASIALFGGSARPDVNWLLFLRPICLFAIAVLIVLPAPQRARSMWAAAILLALLAATIAVQLVPLPPSLWTGLPGHQRYTEAALAAGIEQPWRPISLAPWRTWNSLFALLPPAAMLVALWGIAPRHESRLIAGFLLFVGLNLFIGVLQVSGALNGPPLPYRFFAENSVIGFFANRNHTAAFLATGFPILRMWSLNLDNRRPGDDRRQSRRRMVALIAAMVLLVMIVVTGSRSGMVVGFFALAASLAMWPLDEVGKGMRRDHANWLRIAVIAVPLAMVILLILFGKALAVDRFVEDDLLAEKRITFLPLLIGLVRDFLPFGSGFGTFDPVFRSNEPDWGLSLQYFNNAHNDLVELALTGGVPALLVLAGFVGWIAVRLIASYRQMPPREAISVRAGAVMAAALLGASLTDYPLRTPLAGAVMVFAAFLVARPLLPGSRTTGRKEAA